MDLKRAERGSRDERFLRVLKLRGSAFVAGNHALHLTQSGIEAFRRFITPAAPPDYSPVFERLKSGISPPRRHGRDRLVEGDRDAGRGP